MASFGEELRRERELRAISLREIAESTKISARHLEALEANDFDSLPEGTVFRKGYVRAYCEYIGIDPDGMINAYLLEERSRADRGGATDEGVLRGRGVRAGTAPAAAHPPASPRAVVWVVIAAVTIIAAAGLAWLAWNALDRDEPGPDSTSLAAQRAGDGRG